jgi:hypothetical protein
MPLEPEALLALLRDPNAESRTIAEACGAPREEVGRAARLVLSIGKAKAEEVATLPAPLARAVLVAAAAAGRTDVLAAVAAGPNRDVAKEAKRTLHMLRVRGVAVPELPRSAPPPPAAPAEPEMPCYASLVDGQGERAIWLARTVPGKGVEVAQAIVSDLLGLVSLQVGVLGRKEYRAFAADIVARGGNLGVAEITREAAHGVVAEAARQGEAAGKSLPPGAAAWLTRLGAAPPAPDPGAAFPPLPADEERAAVAGSGALHDLPLLRGWLADEEALRAVAARLDEIAASPIYVDDRQRDEQAGRIIDEAVTAYFDAARRARWARRLLLAAAHLAGTGDAESARRAAASSRALAAGADPLDVPFARLLFEKALPKASAPAAAPRSPLITSPR